MAIVGGRVSEGFPDFGAIFMCNKRTKDECFGRGIFGLPLSFANFVNHVKAGMLLFLFEYEGRNLYGVFEATSDGRMNIKPRAYCSSGKSFPAQVCFRVVWRCHPLPAHTFRDAIRDNYYSANKFSFGLSKKQVERLVWLFQSRRRIKVEKYPKVKDLKKLSTKSSKKMNAVGAAQTDQNTSSGSGSFELQGEVECKNTSTDSYLLEDYIPLSDPEHSDPANAVCLQNADSSEGKDQNDHELCHKVKSMYCDTVQERPSVFSRLQYGARAFSQVQEENIHTKLELKYSLSEQEGGQMTSEPHPHPVQTVMKALETLHEKWTSKNATTRLTKKKKKKKTSVFSRINFLPQVPVMPNVEVNKVPCTDNASNGFYTVEAKETTKKRSRQVCILDNGDGNNTVVTIQVNDSPRPVIVKPSSPSLDCNQVFGMPFPESQHKKMKLCVQ
ncbi:hypothetical protein DM860_005259 [Cuscuta australis]|uniref:DCD domain-containing protein n=1 Tax=Cuscuta australis TaxID=267555 RepID=A0A328E368_9ASTE|nr:hypothetical protein DM860_005259 [Cuscuta australis]